VTRFRGFIALVARLAALLATSYFLVATSPRYDRDGSYKVQDCRHAGESVRYRVTGTCGPQGEIVVSSTANECGIAVQGGGAVGLPSAGRFEEHDDATVSLAGSVWTLSGYLPERSLPDGGASAADAGVFAVVRDAQAGPDLGGFSVIPGVGSQPAAAGQHPEPVLRTCTRQGNPPKPLSLVCTGGSSADCEAVLTPL